VIIWSIAKTTVGDALRKKVLQIFLVVAIGLIIISLSFSQSLSFSTRAGSSTDMMIVKTFGLGLMALAGWLISLVMGVSLIPQEIERRTIYTILSKPVNRYEFIIGKFLGAIITLAINIGLMGVVFIIVVAVKAHGAVIPAAQGIPGAIPQRMGLFDANVVYGIVMIYLQFMVLSSVVLMFSTFLTPTVNFFMGLGVYIIGLMGSVTQTMMTSESASSFVRGMYYVMHYAIPNFDSFNVTNTLLHPETNIAHILPTYTAKIGLYGLLYALLMTTIAVIIFQRKEV
jgi:ABC-type transport system involved in multi-copper enzyme maturation permease subunit